LIIRIACHKHGTLLSIRQIRDGKDKQIKCEQTFYTITDYFYAKSNFQ